LKALDRYAPKDCDNFETVFRKIIKTLYSGNQEAPLVDLEDALLFKEYQEAKLCLDKMNDN